MKRVSKIILRIEEVSVMVMLSAIAIFVFWSALSRRIGRPINWAQDIALLIFAWLTFIGGDLICKSGMLINIDMFFNIFPKRVKKALTIVFNLSMLIFLAILIWYGFILVSQSWTRMFNTLPLSYAWATMAVPVGSVLMSLTIIEDLIKNIKKPISEWEVESND